jgi:hypothetical protein
MGCTGVDVMIVLLGNKSRQGGWSLLLGVMLGLAIATPTLASPICHSVAGQDICILSIKRSAKYHWEYRAEVSVNGQKRPLEVYDCRRRVRQKANGITVAFADDGVVGPFLCGLTEGPS